MNLLITGAWQGASDHLDEIRAMRHNVRFMQWEKDALPCDPNWVEGVIGNGLFLNHAIENFANLQYIQLTSAGFDRVPMDYVEEHQIEIHNARGVYSIPMAEYALAGVLSLYKQMDRFREQQKAHVWVKNRSLLELADKRVLVVGCGSVGTECARRFKAFGCRVTGIDLFVHEDPGFDEILGIDHLDEQLSEADILVLTVPLNDETKNLIALSRLRILKQNAVIVNIARGGVLDLGALIGLKQQGCPLMAVLDVFDEEPLAPDHPIWDMEGVIVTPHNSFVGEFNGQRLAHVILDNLKSREIKD